MNKLAIALIAVIAVANLIATILISIFTASKRRVNHDWENQHVFQINRLPARAFGVPYNSMETATGELKDSEFTIMLNGHWKFHFLQMSLKNRMIFSTPIMTIRNGI